MYLAVTFITTQFSKMKECWQKHAPLRDLGILGSMVSLKRDLGGVVALIDWNRQSLIAQIPAHMPTGICFVNNRLLINSLGDDRIYAVQDSGKLVEVVSHPHFNCLHSLCPTDRGFLVTSSGLDLILEIATDGNVLFEWWAVDHGYDITPLGLPRSIDRTVSHQGIPYPTLFQTTHVNSAIYVGSLRTEILATLFHQGTVICIDTRTAEHRVMIEGLVGPHALHRVDQETYTCVDSARGRILFFDLDGYVLEEIAGDFAWLQDVSVASNGNLLASDSNHHRIVELSYPGGQVVKELGLPTEWRVFQTIEVACPDWLDRL